MHPQAPAWGLQQAIELELVMQEIETVPVAALLLERPFANCVCLAVAKQP